MLHERERETCRATLNQLTVRMVNTLQTGSGGSYSELLLKEQLEEAGTPGREERMPACI